MGLGTKAGTGVGGVAIASALAVWPKPTGWESAGEWAWKAIPTELESLEDTAVSWTKSGDDALLIGGQEVGIWMEATVQAYRFEAHGEVWHVEPAMFTDYSVAQSEGDSPKFRRLEWCRHWQG